MKGLNAIVLAAGKGRRMKSALPKVLHPVCGKPMLFFPLKVIMELGVKDAVVVVGCGRTEIEQGFKNRVVEFSYQKEQLGTGHAVMCAVRELKDFRGDVLILSGDVPLITKNTVKALIKVHGSLSGRPVISFISVILEDPSGYGRVIRDSKDRVERIVEEGDLKGEEKAICEVNSGIYLVDGGFLKESLKRLGTKNVQREYYLPDLVKVAYKQNKRVKALTHINPEEVMGVNNRIELARANAIMRERILNELMLDGTTFVDPSTAYIDYGVRVGRDTTVYPNVHLLGNTVIGKGCIVEEGARIKDSSIGDGSVIRSFSVIESSKVGRKVTIGPFARLRPGNVIGDSARIGNFVEVKKTTIGRNTKANHLSYLGDAVIGKDVNIGAGTITCNYDGFKKHKTIIEDRVFIGSDSQLVAPVTVGKGAYIGSGSTITKDVPPGALGISRPEQRTIEGWVKRKRLKKEGK